MQIKICRVSSVKMTRTTLAVLAAFIDAGPGGKLYGLEIMKTAGIQSGTLYPILDRLEDAGWIDGEWGPSDHEGRPARRNYHLTADGLASARQALAESRLPTSRDRRRPNTGPVTA
jgi:PadR family transcriptional regulator, regulatory protein PadR